MQKKYPDDVVGISLNVDHDQADTAPSDDLREEVLAKLSELNLETVNLMTSDPFDEMLERYDLFSLPAAIVYDREGKKLKTFEGDLSYEKQIFPLLESVVSPAE